MEHNPLGWPQVAAIASFCLFLAFGISLIVPAPWLILSNWLEERAKIKTILAKARLAEAEAAVLRAKRDKS